MNFRDRAKPQETGFQIAPMIDVVFLLLIFFIVTWAFARWETELDVQVPAATEGQAGARTKGEIIINVRADGAMVVQGAERNEEELEGMLIALSEMWPDQAVILRGDVSAPYREIVKVLDICRRARIWNVAFATTQPQAAPLEE